MFGIATINSVEYQSLADVTNPSKIEYCDRHGYSFYSLVGSKYSSNMGFNKIHFVLELLKQHPGLEWLLWCDCDAMITNFTVHIEDRIDNNFHFIVPLDRLGINAGNFLVRNTEEGRAYLQMIIDKESTYITHWGAEQQVIIDTYNNYKRIVKIVPQRFMNSYEQQPYLPHWVNVSKDAAGNSGIWEQGDWIIHWPGLDLQVRMDRAKELTKLIIKENNNLIINITPETFGNFGIRNGDMIAIINVLQYLRKKHNNPNIKFYMPNNYVIQDTGYHQRFFDYLCEQWDFFSKEPNSQNVQLPYEHIMLWDFRDNIGDVVTMSNNREMKKKVVIFPVLDAQYNTMRNWPPWLFLNIIEHCCRNYPDHEKITCVREGILDNVPLGDFIISTDLITNVEHIRDCEVFVGGDTGSSHFASALDRGPKELVYFYPARGMTHVLPFHIHSGKGLLNTYSTQYDMNLF